jgi:RNA polymerase sigma-70 factor, ECF subfamily
VSDRSSSSHAPCQERPLEDRARPAAAAPPPPTGEAGEGGEETPSWEDVATRYGPTIYTMAYRLTGDRDEARDLTQDVFVRVYRNLDRYRPGTFEGWLYRITKNLFLDRVRRGGRLRLEPLPEEEWRQPREQAPGPAEQVEEGVLRGDLERALRELPTTFRTAVVLCDVQGLTYEEIADATGWPIGTVRSRIHRGRRLLRRQLDEPRPPRGRRG